MDDETPDDDDESAQGVEGISGYNITNFPGIPEHLKATGFGISLNRRARSGYRSEPTVAPSNERGQISGLDPASRAEKIKLSASYLNTVASGLMVTGVVGPIANYLYGTTSTTSRSPWWLIGEIVALITASVCVHLMARKILERLDR